jgi:O-methyltransferase
MSMGLYRRWRRFRHERKKRRRFADVEPEFWGVYKKCKPFTMTRTERIYVLYQSMRYVVARGIPGDIVECGVWKGGSSMLCALILSQHPQDLRSLYLYDTFAGMAEPGELDVSLEGASAREEWQRHRQDQITDWAYSPLDEVRRNLFSTGFPENRAVFVPGKVEDTIPGIAPRQIALLRLDTDFYSSTYHEMTHLFPRLSPGGILIIDDYGTWKGARQAVDQYAAENHLTLLLTRIDRGARICVKVG